MNIFRRFRSATGAPPPARTAKGERIYAIGDVHGRYDLLRRLFDRIAAHSSIQPATRSSQIILLGDLVDRGPQSREVVDFITSLNGRYGQVTVLMGNHEELMLAVVGGRLGALNAWRDLGGDATLRSYGLTEQDLQLPVPALVRRAQELIPQHHLDSMRRWPLSVQSGDYLFCHAGIRPGIPLRRQTATDLLWIRREFLDDETDHGMVVVHGHSVSEAVDMRTNRIGIDTGAYRTGQLTALYLDGDAREILTA